MNELLDRTGGDARAGRHCTVWRNWPHPIHPVPTNNGFTIELGELAGMESRVNGQKLADDNEEFSPYRPNVQKMSPS